MSAHRLLNEQGELIGAILLDRKGVEDEIVNGLPELRLDYSTTLTNVVAFTLVVIPPDPVPNE